MGERTQKVVLRDGQVLKYWSRWGGQSCVDELVAGFQGFADNLSFDRSETDWMDAVWAEGGYLVDFERKKILLYSWDRDYLEKVTPAVSKAWPGWSIELVDEGVPDFQRYVDSIL